MKKKHLNEISLKEIWSKVGIDQETYILEKQKTIHSQKRWSVQDMSSKFGIEMEDPIFLKDYQRGTRSFDSFLSSFPPGTPVRIFFGTQLEFTRTTGELRSSDLPSNLIFVANHTSDLEIFCMLNFQQESLLMHYLSERFCNSGIPSTGSISEWKMKGSSFEISQSISIASFNGFSRINHQLLLIDSLTSNVYSNQIYKFQTKLHACCYDQLMEIF